MEDLMTMTLLGIDDWERARTAAKSFDFKDYIIAKDEKGKYIIKEEHQTFLKQLMYNISRIIPEGKLRLADDGKED